MNDRQLVALMAAVLEAGDRANSAPEVVGGVRDSAYTYVFRANELLAEVVKQDNVRLGREGR